MLYEVITDFDDDEDDDEPTLNIPPASVKASEPVRAPRFSASRVRSAPVVSAAYDEDDDDEPDDREPTLTLPGSVTPSPAARVTVSTPSRSEPLLAPGLSALDEEDDELLDVDLPWMNDEDEPDESPTAAPLSPAKPARPKVEGVLPSFGLLDTPPAKTQMMTPEELDRIARLVEAKLADYNVQSKVVGVYPGPVITRFELDLAPGLKASKIRNNFV